MNACLRLCGRPTERTCGVYAHAFFQRSGVESVRERTLAGVGHRFGERQLHVFVHGFISRVGDDQRAVLRIAGDGPAVAGRWGSICSGCEQGAGFAIAVGEAACAQGDIRGDLCFALVQRGPSGQCGFVVLAAQAGGLEHTRHIGHVADVPPAQVLVEP